MTHDYLDLELCAATAHHDLIAGAAVTARPADFAELRLTSDADVGVISQGDRQGSRLGADPIAAGRDRALDRGLPSLYQGIVDLGDVEQLGSSSGDPHLAEMRHPLGAQAACRDLHVDDHIWIDTEKELLAETQGAEVVEAAWGTPQDAEPVQRGAQLTVAGHLEDGAVAPQHVRSVGGQRGH